MARCRGTSGVITTWVPWSITGSISSGNFCWLWLRFFAGTVSGVDVQSADWLHFWNQKLGIERIQRTSQYLQGTWWEVSQLEWPLYDQCSSQNDKSRNLKAQITRRGWCSHDQMSTAWPVALRLRLCWQCLGVHGCDHDFNVLILGVAYYQPLVITPAPRSFPGRTWCTFPEGPEDPSAVPRCEIF